jgi:hypothetical protein
MAGCDTYDLAQTIGQLGASRVSLDPYGAPATGVGIEDSHPHQSPVSADLVVFICIPISASLFSP